MAINTLQYIENYLKIQNKDAEIIPLKLNKPQMKLYNALAEQYKRGKPQRAIVLKARQMGFSTLTEAMIFKKTTTASNVKSGIITHEAQATNNLFGMSKRYLNYLPDDLKPHIKNSNAKELIFDDDKGKGLNSIIKCMTAGNSSVGRSDTFQNLHISEYAFWEGDKKSTLAGLMQAVPNKINTMVIIESTANGFDDFKELWDRAVAGESDYVPVFCAWWELDEYRMPYTGFELTEEERSLKERFNLDDDQLEWRRWCIKNNCQGRLDMFHQEYPSYPEEAFVSSGACVFDVDKIIKRQGEVKAPIKRGSFIYEYNGLELSKIRWQEQERGAIRIYKEPRERAPYVIGGDTAGDGSDSFVGQVIDNMTGEQVAVLEEEIDEDLYARQMYCLGMYYNEALLSIEANFSTHPIKELQRLNYPKQYVRQTEDDYMHSFQKKYGFRTTSVTRPVIIAELVQIFRETPELINDRKTLDEMLTFIKNERGRAEAMQGKHDDHVMALAIGYHSRNQQGMTLLKEQLQKKFKWEDDLLEDYYNASEEIKRLMEKEYGLPN